MTLTKRELGMRLGDAHSGARHCEIQGGQGDESRRVEAHAEGCGREQDRAQIVGAAENVSLPRLSFATSPVAKPVINFVHQTISVLE